MLLDGRCRPGHNGAGGVAGPQGSRPLLISARRSAPSPRGARDGGRAGGKDGARASGGRGRPASGARAANGPKAVAGPRPTPSGPERRAQGTTAGGAASGAQAASRPTGGTSSAAGAAGGEGRGPSGGRGRFAAGTRAALERRPHPPPPRFAPAQQGGPDSPSDGRPRHRSRAGRRATRAGSNQATRRPESCHASKEVLLRAQDGIRDRNQAFSVGNYLKQVAFFE